MGFADVKNDREEYQTKLPGLQRLMGLAPN
jgi:hypothetical protein